MKILDLFIYILTNLSTSNFMIIIFSILVIIALLGLVYRGLK